MSDVCPDCAHPWEHHTLHPDPRGVALACPGCRCDKVLMVGDEKED